MSEVPNMKEELDKEKMIIIIEALAYLKNHNEEDSF